MTNSEILAIAMAQSAEDSGCHWEDFTRDSHTVVLSATNPKARRYLALPFSCDLTTYGNHIVASVSKELEPIISAYIHQFPSEHCFETPNILVLMDKLQPLGLNICFMAEYFLPDVTRLVALPCPYEMRLLTQADFASLYQPQWGNALCQARRERDVLGLGAYENGVLIGLAACAADCDTMWQIGVDVLPSHRRQGVAAALTSGLGVEVLARGIVPFYCCAWSNIKSIRNAIKSGFAPEWVQITAKPRDFIDKINGV